MTERFASKLRVPKKKCKIPVGGVNCLSTSTKHLVTAKIESANRKYTASHQFLTMPEICECPPSQALPYDHMKIPPNIKLADPEFYKPRSVDLLLGSGPSLSLFSSGQYHLTDENNSNIILQKTRLGWVVGGNFNSNRKMNPQKTFTLNIQPDLTKFWEIEEGPFKKMWSPEEEAAENHFIQHHFRDDSGRYVVALPFKTEDTMLGESYDMALKRLLSLERKLNRLPDLKVKYNAVLEEYLELNHMSKISDTNSTGFYLPHHAVIKESSTTTKVRVVFDGSAKTSNGVSLNESLLVGPTIQDDLFSLILRFRTHQYVLTGDIEKMYRQFLVRPEDRKYQRILWRDKQNQLITYELNTVTFGLSAAPFLAIRCLQQLAKDEALNFPIAAHILQRDLYVDDLLTGFNSISEGLEARQQISALLQKGGLNLRQWASNEPSLIQDLPSDSINQKLHFDGDKTLKTLGISWNSSNDSINYTVKPVKLSPPITKRTILSDVAAIFDPLGLLGPVILKAKKIIQKLWSEKVDWDESISLNTQTLWTDICKQLPLINDIHFKRQITIKDFQDIQIHGFSDASETGYGACIYIKSTNRQGQSEINLLCSKSRVAPLKTISIPRLELCGAHTLANLYQSVKKAITLPVSKTVLWTDSMITLHWINSPPHTLKTFVQNRVSEIQNQTENCDWRHVVSADNPADALSRGQLPAEFIDNTLWRHGPIWLQKSENDWPNQDIKKPTEDNETKQTLCLKTTLNTLIFEKYSSFGKMIRIFVYCFRFIAKIRHKPFERGLITLAELNHAKHRIVKIFQQVHFAEEIYAITKLKPGDALPNNRLKQLSPFIDDDGILRVGGRLNNARIPYSQQHPILLPPDNTLTPLIILEYHLFNAHAGVQATLHAIRQRYWIVNGRNQVRKIIRNCVICRRANPSPTNYIMGNLPAARVNSTINPFTNVGVDYCGPFYIKEKKFRNRSQVKVYVAVFICLAVKAVHLEVVSDMTSAGFIAALERFIARRGTPTSIESDNGTNFTGANNELKQIIINLQKPDEMEKINNNLSNRGIIWKFTPPLSPHFGGVWEAAVKSFKHHLIRVSSNILLTFEEFNTLVIKIEGILNSRPLTPLSSDPNDLQALTPGHFLKGDTPINLPEVDFTDVKTNLLTRWQLIQKLKQDFWSRWHKEYLNELNIRKKWTTGSHDIQKGSIVLLKEDNIPPMQWKLGRVIETHPGSDNIIRVVTIKTATGLFKRNVTRVAALPVPCSSN